ncbi:ATP-grasp domain-containing protein [uncultured Ruegeria sp.]|uniref:ATP-grasp domain-containing protein n=1 Tax=uncultured Ruegeria sp. TaxID=259304 RepID=UPI0026098388|nr:ATP-grasp domain-containing protein [uncultured Ruegeria sp.]
MTHVLFVDSNVPGFDTMRIALDRGYVVSFLQPKHRLYTDTDLTKSVKAGVHNLISIENPTSFYEVARAMALIQSVLPIDGVITQLEPCVDAVAKACVVHNIRFTNATAVQNSKNKRKARELVEQAKLKSGFHAIGKTADDVGKIAARYGKPVVVKPQVAFDSILPVAAQTSPEAKQAAQDILDRIDDLAPEIRGQIANDLLVEELLVGPLVSIELGLLDGEFFRFMISGRPRAKANDCIKMGTSMPAQISFEDQENCCVYAEQVAKALGLDIGIFHIEMILTTEGPALVEVNPRLMGCVIPSLYENVTGDCLLNHLIDIHLGKRPRWKPVAPKTAITTRKLMPTEDGKLPTLIDLHWVHNQPDIIQFDPYKLNPNASVKAHDILARFQVKSDTITEADSRANRYLSKMAEELQIKLFE